jgi:exosortase/archaeosortase family protein
MWVIDASSGLAKAAGIAVMQSGTQLLAPDGRYNYDVAAACSGVRSLTALAALSLLAGYLNFRAWWRRGLVLLLCFPLVYLGNVARISAIIFAAQLGGQAWGERAHEVMGYGVFVIVLGGVLAAVNALRRWAPEAGNAAGREQTCHSLDDNNGERPGRGERPVCHLMDDKMVGWAAVVIVGLAAGEMVFLHHLSNSPARGQVGVVLAADGQNPVELPAFIGHDWIGRRAEVTPVEREILPPDTGFSRKTYVSLADAKNPVLLSLVLSGRDRTSIHRPELCLVGQGWTIASMFGHEFRHPGDRGAGSTAPAAAAPAKQFPATVLRVRREVPTPRGKVVVPQLVAYWFVGGDTVVATHWQRIARDAWNRVAHARVDRWAYVLMQTDAADGEAAALGRMQAVLDGTLPAFQPKKS